MVSLNQIDAILLAAGASKRLGEPKALVDIHGKSLIEILIKKLKKNNLRVIIVTRKDLVIEMEKLGEKVVVNMKPEDGRTGSIQCGIKELESERCLIVPVDRPGFSNETIEKLINSDKTSCPSKNGKGGHPVILSRKDCEEILSRNPSTPLRDIIKPIKIEVNDEYLHLNIDFPEDLEKLREITIEHNL
ncbi:MAG: hypothetical protein CMA98_03910 [Euryarchaeota archaeon]|nr:hypothetical protein [Euryarchaeota archaeon]MDP6293011.1 nucleotidyltransferase family protein [Candidatus Thalassarchaeaceae archaeon]